MINARLRTARLLHELANKQHSRVEIRVGTAVLWTHLQTQGTDAEATRYLRQRSYLLAHRSPLGHTTLPARAKKTQPVATAVPPHLIDREVSALLPAQRLVESNGLEVYLAEPGQIPAALAEIGRLREITFRAAGEGTGREYDLDSFDTYYQHLFIWSPDDRRIIGAYRLASSLDILNSRGVNGLYTSTLFEYRDDLFARVGPAIELGRSFVRVEYQKQYAPLLLLWKGIAALIAQRPDHPVLFGAVSISNNYHPISQRLIVRHLQAHQLCPDMAALVRPRRPFRAVRRGNDDESISLMLRDVDELSSVTAEIEPDGKGIPILLTQYLRLGGKLMGFNVDRTFSNTLDGLIMVDLRQTPGGLLQRYLGKEAAAKFVAWHAPCL